MLSFIACDHLSIMRIGKEGHNIFTYACKILLPEENWKRQISFILIRKMSKKCVFDGLAS